MRWGWRRGGVQDRERGRTLICERPKIGPHAAAMQARLEAIMGLEAGRISVKATTSERLGFTGREEGIAALATVTLVGGMSRIVATFFGVGYLSPASGTWASAAALPLGFLLHGLGGFPALAVATAVAFLAGVWATERMTAAGEDKDPSEIVIDEVAGMWIALWPLSAGLGMRGRDPWVFPGRAGWARS